MLLSTTTQPPPPSAASPPPHKRTHYFPCWTCQLPVPSASYFCPYCSKITNHVLLQDKDARRSCTYFDLLQVPSPHSFSVDCKQLERSYRKLAMQLHPDQFSQRSPREQDLSAHHASRLNEAYSTLKSPLRRALYMLELLGVNALGSEESNHAPTTTTASGGDTDMEILTETMELREQLDEAESVAEYEALKSDVRHRIDQVESDLATELGDVAHIDGAVRTAVRLRYLEKVLEEVSDKIRNFGDEDK